MRLRLSALGFSFAAVLAVMGCGDDPIPAPTPDPRIDELQGLLQDLGQAVGDIGKQVTELQATPTPTATPSATPTSTPRPTPIRTSTPLPTVTPGPTLVEIAALVERRVTSAIEANPTATPGATLQDVEVLVNEIVSEAVAAVPTATPAPVPTPAPTATPVSLPAVVAFVPQVSGPGRTDLPLGATITVDPGQPLAGRDVEFTLDGLRPWQDVIVQFLDPLGRPAAWVSEDEAHFTPVDEQEVTQRRLFADQNGSLRWERFAALDTEGIWAVRLSGLGLPVKVTYPVADLQLPLQEIATLGVQLRGHQGLASKTFYSSLVPAALAVDVQAHLSSVLVAIQEQLGVRSGRIPDLYLLWGNDTLKTVEAALGLELAFEAGFFKSAQPNSGIYVQADFFRSDVLRIITHEYVHLVLDEVSGGERLPAWLNEGLADYMEFELALDAADPKRSRRALYGATDLAVAAAASGELFPIRSLESRFLWASRRDKAQVDLQYAQSHMAVRYIVETFGAESIIDVVRAVSAGADLGDAIQQATGLAYAAFEDRYLEYLRTWADPDREAVRQYAAVLEGVLDRRHEITTRRSEVIQLPRAQRVAPAADMVSDTLGLLEDLERVSPPDEMQDLHSGVLEFLGRLGDWLTLELEFARTGLDSKRVEANEMIREINARTIRVSRGLQSVIFNYQLAE